MGLDNPLHIAFLVVILLLVFGAKRLPEIGRSLGSGMREFKQAVTGHDTAQQPPAQQPALNAGQAQPQAPVSEQAQVVAQPASPSRSRLSPPRSPLSPPCRRPRWRRSLLRSSRSRPPPRRPPSSRSTTPSVRPTTLPARRRCRRSRGTTRGRGRLPRSGATTRGGGSARSAPPRRPSPARSSAG